MNWKNFLSQVSETVIKSDDLLDMLKADNQSGWLGYPGVTEREIIKHEERLKTKLPPSYREFLKVSNGFKQLNTYVWDMLPADKIDWLRSFDPSFYELYSNNLETFDASDKDYFVYGEEQRSTDFRSRYLIESLAVSNWGDAAIVLLNPNVKFGEEWEAWVFIVWSYGPTRYRSFEELMKEEYASFLQLLNDSE
jgi:hypothetical protein